MIHSRLQVSDVIEQNGKRETLIPPNTHAPASVKGAKWENTIVAAFKVIATVPTEQHPLL